MRKQVTRSVDRRALILQHDYEVREDIPTNLRLDQLHR